MMDKKKVLIIEDDQEIQKIYASALAAAGFEAVPAVSGDFGLQVARDDAPQLIMLDIMLPGHRNGFDVLEELKRDETLKKIPVIVLTNLETEKQVALEIGAKDYLVKSNTSIDDVVASVKKYIS